MNEMITIRRSEYEQLMNQSVELKDLQESVGHPQKDLNNIAAMFNTLASICSGSVYVIDFKLV
jgi:hypothetical protein